MKKKESKIIYLFILLIVLLGVACFIFRAKLADTFLHYDFGEMAILETPNNELNLDLLQKDKVRALKNNVSLFNYEDLNITQDLLAEEFRNNLTVPSDLEPELDKPVFFRVSVGNNNPFTADKLK